MDGSGMGAPGGGGDITGSARQTPKACTVVSRPCLAQKPSTRAWCFAFSMTIEAHRKA